MSEQMDFLKDAISAYQYSLDAFDRSEEATSDRMRDAALRVSAQNEHRAMTLALLSLAQDVRRVADALSEIEGTYLEQHS